MTPDERFLEQPKRFWANVRLLSKHIGYTERIKRKKGEPKSGTGRIKVPSQAEVVKGLADLGLSSDHLCGADGTLTDMGRTLLDYFQYRADVLNDQVEKNLMNASTAKSEYTRLKDELNPTCPLPANKQKGDKKGPNYFTCIINMLIQQNAEGMPCNYNPQELTTFTLGGHPVRTLARRVDGAFPSTVNPVALWEIKEYYFTTTFGSRVADGVYETLVDGIELEELQMNEGISAEHCLMVDDHFTWWVKGKSYLCRLIDMLHMGYIDEVLFGKEVIERLPVVVKAWVTAAKESKYAGDPPIVTDATVTK